MDEEILFVSTHGQFEKGKDVITRTASGEIRAYQLKAGNISVGEWRKIQGEINDLVELPIEFPGSPPISDFVPVLVTNGEVTAPVLEQIRANNVSWRQRGFVRELQLIQRGELFHRFRASHGSYLPRELEDFTLFLELILRDGSAPADKEKAAKLFEHILPDEPEKSSKLNLLRASASVALLTAYITGPATRALNHWALFEYWVLAASYVLRLLELSGADVCRAQFEICERAAERALHALAQECEERSHLVEGFPLVDGHTYRARITILLGLLCAWELSLRIRGWSRSMTNFVTSFLASRLKECQSWGESSTPFLFAAILALEQSGSQAMAEGVAIQIVREISAANGDEASGRGVPNPYYSAEEALRLAYQLDPLNDEQFVGFSYSVGPLVGYLARRWRRRALAGLWHPITRLSLLEFRPATAAEWYRWESSNGVLDSQLPGQPQSWSYLRDEAATLSVDNLPPTLRTRPAFALWFALVYPHRFTSAVAKLIEDALMLT